MRPDGDEIAGKRPVAGVVAVVDDDLFFREALVAALLSLGFFVVDFETPQAALAAMGQIMPACLLIDLDLPGMSGLDLYATLLRQGLDAPAIFITGNASADARNKVLAAGAAACLDKPVALAELERLIRSVAR